jgi:hypothetical protein
MKGWANCPTLQRQSISTAVERGATDLPARVTHAIDAILGGQAPE